VRAEFNPSAAAPPLNPARAISALIAAMTGGKEAVLQRALALAENTAKKQRISPYRVAAKGRPVATSNHIHPSLMVAFLSIAYFNAWAFLNL
jgi:hypothetical protein